MRPEARAFFVQCAQMPLRVFVPPTWDGKAALPIILMLHGAGANESSLREGL